MVRTNPLSLGYFNSHRASSACDYFDAAFFVNCVELVFLDLSDLSELCTSDLANLFAMWFAAALFDADFFSDLVVNWLTERFPGERAVFEHL